MKLACTSAAFAAAVERGDLTQLEFIDHAARKLACDGVVLDIRQFPRRDADYAAQVKKMAADLGLCIAAFAVPALFSSGQAEATTCLEMAQALGAPLLFAPLALEVAMSWSEQLTLISHVTAAAKVANVTLAVRNAPGTFAATSSDCKRVGKEADSAWLRFGFEPATFDAASDASELASKTVLLTAGLDETALLEEWAWFRGFVTLDRADGCASIEEMQSAMRRWHIARATIELNRT